MKKKRLEEEIKGIKKELFTQMKKIWVMKMVVMIMICRIQSQKVKEKD